MVPEHDSVDIICSRTPVKVFVKVHGNIEIQFADSLCNMCVRLILLQRKEASPCLRC